MNRSAVARRGRDPSTSRSGAVMMEFVISFPLVLVLILGIVQFAHLWVARIVVHYAAYCGARAALVTVCDPQGPSLKYESFPKPEELPVEGLRDTYCTGSSIAGGRSGMAISEGEWAANKAAVQVCAWINMGAGGGGANVTVPNWGEIPGTDSAERKTRATIEFREKTVGATVEHDFALIVPIVGSMIAWGMNPWDDAQPWAVTQEDVTENVHSTLDAWPYPHLRLTEMVLMQKPFRTAIAAGNYDGYPAGTHEGTGW